MLVGLDFNSPVAPIKAARWYAQKKYYLAQLPGVAGAAIQEKAGSRYRQLYRLLQPKQNLLWKFPQYV